MSSRIFILCLIITVLMLGVSGAAVLVAQISPHDPLDVMAYTSLHNGSREILIADLTHELTYPVTRFDSLVDAPDWSPDGRKIAFHSGHESGYKVYVFDLFDGSLVKFNSYTNTFDLNPTWSPDGQRLAFLVEDGTQPGSKVWIASLDAPDAPELVADIIGFKSSVSWSPDGESITFHNAGLDSRRAVVFVDLADGHTTRLQTGNVVTGWPQWSPDGNKLVFLAETLTGNDIMVMDNSGEQPAFRPVTENDLIKHDPQWSPEGDAIAFLAGSEPQSIGFYSRIYTVNLEGGETRLLYMPEGLIASPTWRR